MSCPLAALWEEMIAKMGPPKKGQPVKSIHSRKGTISFQGTNRFLVSTFFYKGEKIFSTTLIIGLTSNILVTRKFLANNILRL